MAEYPLSEVLDRQSEQVRRRRTSVLERVNGGLAGLLNGVSGGERVLQELEEANAFVVALDAARSARGGLRGGGSGGLYPAGIWSGDRPG